MVYQFIPLYIVFTKNYPPGVLHEVDCGEGGPARSGVDPTSAAACPRRDHQEAAQVFIRRASHFAGGISPVPAEIFCERRIVCSGKGMAIQETNFKHTLNRFYRIPGSSFRRIHDKIKSEVRWKEGIADNCAGSCYAGWWLRKAAEAQAT